MAKGKKTGGRKAGTPNKATAFSKSVIQDILTDYTNSDLFHQDMKDLEPKDRLDIMVKLMAFTTPKPQSVNMSINTNKPRTIEDTLAELSQEEE